MLMDVGDLKSIIVQKTGLKPETCKLLFRGKEKDDDEFLQTAGLKDNCKVLLMEDTTCRENVPEEVKEASVPEEVKETIVISQGEAAVAEVRREVDNLADQVAALQAVVDSETKVDNKDIIYMTEMLMRVLLRLDGIVAEGEGRIQRKMEVCRVQSLVETLDLLKTKNSTPLSHGNNNVTVTTQWETFETGPGSLSTMYTAPASVPSPTLMPSSPPTPAPVQSSTPASSPTPISVPSSIPTSSPIPISVPSSTPASSPTPTPNPVPSSNHTPVPFTIPTSTHVPSSAASFMPTSTKLTQEWENFD
ncbi:hypothetical protein ACS0TY_015713 [Phlomoides rotata]